MPAQAKNIVITGLFRKAHFDWDTFDALPRETKEICWYSVTTIMATGPIRDLPATKATIALKTGISTFNTYGPDQPQAIVPGHVAVPTDIDF